MALQFPVLFGAASVASVFSKILDKGLAQLPYLTAV